MKCQQLFEAIKLTSSNFWNNQTSDNIASKDTTIISKRKIVNRYTNDFKILTIIIEVSVNDLQLSKIANTIP